MASDGDEGQEIQVHADSAVKSGSMSVEDALQLVLKKSLINGGLVRGAKECVRMLDRKQAHLCVLNEACEEKGLVQLIEALCKEHDINLIKVGDGKKLGEWAGLCKIDREGNPRKIISSAVVVVKDFGEDSEAMNVLLEYFKKH